MTTAESVGTAVVQWIEEHLVGTPYEHQGRLPGPHGGVDCLGVVICPARALGLAHEDHTDYSRDVDGSKIEAILARYCDRIERDRIQAGDVVLFWVDDNQQHFGVVASRAGVLGFYHALERRAGPSRVKWSRLEGHWKSQICSVWRYRRSEGAGRVAWQTGATAGTEGPTW